MSGEIYHPNAFLSTIKNVKKGLKARTQILAALEKGPKDAKAVATEAGLHYYVVVHHLRLLQKENIIERKNVRPRLWSLTGIGQKRLIDSA